MVAEDRICTALMSKTNIMHMEKMVMQIFLLDRLQQVKGKDVAAAVSLSEKEAFK